MATMRLSGEVTRHAKLSCVLPRAYLRRQPAACVQINGSGPAASMADGGSLLASCSDKGEVGLLLRQTQQLHMAVIYLWWWKRPWRW